MQVDWANDGANGLEMARKSLPDLILLDVQLPGMNGFQVCQRLKDRRRTADIPIVMLTRHDDPEAVKFGLQAGAVHYIPKDAFANAVLLETIRQLGLTGDESFDDVSATGG
jgi:DNA-binding response OmpR family regulator